MHNQFIIIKFFQINSFRFFDQKSKALYIKLSYYIFRDESKMKSKEQELKNLIEQEINSLYLRNQFNNFKICDQREFEQEIYELEQFIRNSFMSKSEIQRSHDNFDFSLLE